MDTILALTKGTTAIEFNTVDICKTHNTLVKGNHFAHCSLLNSELDLRMLAQHARRGLRNLTDTDRMVLINGATSLTLRLSMLRENGTFEKTKLPFKTEKDKEKEVAME